MKQNPAPTFSWKKRARSFVYAFRGMAYVLRTQHNAWIHLFFTLLVLGFGFFFWVSPIEWALLALAIGSVWAAEAFNTALEALVDLVSPQYHRQAEIAKDAASGAVLWLALSAAAVGFCIFLPKIWAWLWG
ncbi:MAG: diacylglycerol kinase family protein [Microscillaceae bacterium]